MVRAVRKTDSLSFPLAQRTSRRFWYLRYEQAADLSKCARLHADERAPSPHNEYASRAMLVSFMPLTVLTFVVLGVIFFGLATPTEAAAMGAAGALVLAA